VLRFVARRISIASVTDVIALMYGTLKRPDSVWTQCHRPRARMPKGTADDDEDEIAVWLFLPQV